MHGTQQVLEMRDCVGIYDTLSLLRRSRRYVRECPSGFELKGRAVGEGDGSKK